MKVTFFVPGLPVAQPRQKHTVTRTGKIHNYTPTLHPVNAYKTAVQTAALKVFGLYGRMSGPVRMTAVFYFPRPKTKVWKTKEMHRYPHTSKPDADNLIKSTKDALKGIAWNDDSQVYDERTIKFGAGSSDPIGVSIEIEQED